MADAGLTVELNGGNQRFRMEDGKPLILGRTRDCDICLPSPAVSRRHVVFMCKGGEYGIKDLGSANGTLVNGKLLTRSRRLRDGDVIQISSFSIKFSEKLFFGVSEAVPEAAPPEKAEAAPSMAQLPGTEPPLQPEAEPLPDPPEPRDALQPEPGTDIEPAQPELPEPSELPEESDSAASVFDGDDLPAAMASLDDPAAEEIFSEPESELAEPPSSPPPPPLPPPQSTEPPPPERAEPPPLVKAERPEIPKFFDDSAGAEKADDEADDASFKIEDEPDAASPEALQLAIAKAAAEAGLVGEFTPETGDEPPAGGEERAAPPPPPKPQEAGPESPESGNAVPLDAAMRQAVDSRLMLYSFLDDMRNERASILAKHPELPDPVKSELARQDRELDKIPTAAQASGMIEKRLAKQKELMERIAEAKKKGEQPPAKPSRAMRNAEEMAIAQWRFCADSESKALPAAQAACFKLAESEPIVAILREISQDPIQLLGGGIYYLSLEALLEEAKAARLANKAKLALVPNPEEENKKGGKRAKPVDMEEDEDLPTESYAELMEMETGLANRAAWITAEMTATEKRLIQEFWRLYVELALVYIPKIEQMPMSARAFLRHGAVGFKPWWMKEETRAHLVKDCSEDIVPHLLASKNVTNVVYADEYLAAVANLECTPAMDENLEINERNSPNWKADKALRKVINSRRQAALMEELVGQLRERVEALNAEGAKLDERISKLLPNSKNFKQLKNELGMQRQALKVEATKLSNLADKIRNETLASFKEAEKDTEERFASGELPRPTTEFLIRRECEAVHKIGRLVANLKERFMPLVLRDNFAIGTDAVNDRPAIMAEMAGIERRDPGVFLETLVPSKKKANRVDLRTSPAIVLLPSAGALTYAWSPRSKPEDGRLAIPTLFLRRRVRERQLAYLVSDFRWDTSKAAAGMDVMTSDTIVAGFMTVRWDWRKRSKEGREKGLVFNEQNDRTNWRRIYETYLLSADEAGKKLFNRNYDFYERVILKYFDPPEGVTFLKK